MDGSPPGEQLAAARQLARITLREMARQIGLGHSYLSGIEAGKRVPSDRVIRGYEQVLGLRRGAFDVTSVDRPSRSDIDEVKYSIEVHECSIIYKRDGLVDLAIRRRVRVTRGPASACTFGQW